MVSTFYDHLNDIINELVPKRRRLNSKYPQWYTRSLVNILTDKEKLRKRFRKYGNPRDEMEYRILDDRARAHIKECYKKYVNRMESNIRYNPKAFWSFVKSKNSQSSQIPSVIKLGNIVATNGEDICNLFASQFSSSFTLSDRNSGLSAKSSHVLPQLALNRLSLTERDVLGALHKLDITKGAGPDGLPPIFIKKCARYLALPLAIIFNKSLTTAVFPCEWKIANVVPVYKKGDRADAANYRPISMLSIFSKVFESMVCPVLTAHIQPQIVPQQHGFCDNKSTVTNLVSYVNDLSAAVDAGAQVDALYTDFSSAFDKVDHQMLLLKLESHGVHGSLLEWFGSYLDQRRQRVVVEGYYSSEYAATSGVPQGSHAGPILFIIFVNDLPDCFRHSQCSLFADDLKIYRRIATPVDAELLQCDLNALQTWCNKNRMVLNVKKCHHVCFTRKKQTISSRYSIAGTTLQKVKTIRDLGVLLSSDLSFSSHIDIIVAKAARMTGFIKRTCGEFKNVLAMKILYNCLVRSTLEYASPVWNPSYNVHTSRIERVQRNFTRYLRFKDHTCPNRADYGQRMGHFKLSSLQDRRTSADMIFLYKIVNNKTCTPEILKQISLDVPRRGLVRSARVRRTFATITSRTNLGRSAPLNRLMSTYNGISSSNDDLDIFFDSMSRYKSRVMQIDP